MVGTQYFYGAIQHDLSVNAAHRAVLGMGGSPSANWTYLPGNYQVGELFFKNWQFQVGLVLNFRTVRAPSANW